MRLLALLAPAAVLGVLWALQRLEVWMTARPGPRPSHRPGPLTRSVAALENDRS